MSTYMELVDRWDDDETYDDPAPRAADDRLRHLVFLDGILVDAFTSSLRGSGYECVALEMEAQRRPPVPDPPPTPEWERELERLDRLVGGRVALLGLTDIPLEPRSLPVECVEAAGRLDVLDLGDEFTTAVRNALGHAYESSPRLVASPPEQVAAAVAWLVAKANDMTGARHRLRQADLNRVFGLKAFPSTLAGQLTRELQRFLPESRGSWWGGYPRHELGLADVLLSHVRARLVRERDRALAARARAEGDDEARRSG